MPVLPALRRAAAVLGAASLLLGGAVTAPGAAADGVAITPVPLCTATPFRAAPAQHVWYRIPAIVRTDAGSLVAFAERRRSIAVSSDSGDNDVVVSRSTDAGCHWSRPVVVAAHGTDTVGNPSAVVDRASGDVLLLTSTTPRGSSTLHGLHVQRSTDDGRTFTSYASSGADLAGTPGWTGGLTGPGHALQLDAGAHQGRIVVPITARERGRRAASVLLSDDAGRTWRVGLIAAGDDQRQEGTATQLADGRIWFSYRRLEPSAPVGQGHVAAVSSDGGDTIDAPFARLALPVPSVEASALTLTGPNAGTVLVSSPAGRGSEPSRRIMTIFVSRTAVPGGSWTRYPVTLDDVPASYSDLVQVDDATVGVLYETGPTSWHDGITFRSIRIAALTAGPTVRPTVRSTLPGFARAGRPLVVQVRVGVPGTAAPAGSVRVVVARPGWRRSVTHPLTFPGRGFRVAAFSGLRRGAYTVTTTYLGTPRIRAVTVTQHLRVR